MIRWFVAAATVTLVVACGAPVDPPASGCGIPCPEETTTTSSPATTTTVAPRRPVTARPALPATE